MNAARVERIVVAHRRTTIPDLSLATEFSIGTVYSTVCKEMRYKSRVGLKWLTAFLNSCQIGTKASVCLLICCKIEKIYWNEFTASNVVKISYSVFIICGKLLTKTLHVCMYVYQYHLKGW